MRLAYIDQYLKYLTYLILLLLSIILAYSNVSLFADGAHFFVSMLATKTFADWDKPREFAEILTQSPMVMAIHFGVRNIFVLSRLYAIGLAVIPLLMWSAAIFIQRKKYFWIYVLLFCVTYVSSGFFAIGEYNVCYAATALSSSIMFSKNRSLLKYLVVAFLSVLLWRSYPAMIFLGPLLFIISATQINNEENIYNKLALYLSCFFYGSAWGVSYFSVCYPRDPSNEKGAMDFFTIWKYDRWFIYISAISLAIIIISTIKRKNIEYLAVFFMFVSAILLFGYGPGMAYGARALSGAFLFGVVSLIFAFEIFRVNFYSQRISIAAFAVFVCSVVPFSENLIGFNFWIANISSYVNSHSGLVDIKNAKLPKEEFSKYNWGWNYPDLSVILGSAKNSAILYSPGLSFQPLASKVEREKMIKKIAKYTR